MNVYIYVRNYTRANHKKNRSIKCCPCAHGVGIFSSLFQTFQGRTLFSEFAL
jgi:hypothetical protein